MRVILRNAEHKKPADRGVTESNSFVTGRFLRGWRAWSYDESVDKTADGGAQKRRSSL